MLSRGGLANQGGCVTEETYTFLKRFLVATVLSFSSIRYIPALIKNDYKTTTI